MKLMT